MQKVGRNKSGIPSWVASAMVEEWYAQEDPGLTDLDAGIAEIEAANLAKHYERWHVPHVGGMATQRRDEAFLIFGGQLNSASSTEVRLCKVCELVRIIRLKQIVCQKWASIGVFTPLPLKSGIIVLRRNARHLHAHITQQAGGGRKLPAWGYCNILLSGTGTLYKTALHGLLGSRAMVFYLLLCRHKSPLVNSFSLQYWQANTKGSKYYPSTATTNIQNHGMDITPSCLLTGIPLLSQICDHLNY